MNTLLSYRTYFLLFISYLILIFLSYENRAFQSDDALIYQRYIQNFLEGNGLVYNTGELFNGLTSPLFSYLMLLFSLVIGDIQVAATVVATLSMMGALYLFTLLFAKYDKIEFVSLGALFTVCFSFFYYVYGMETPLFVFLVALCIYLFEKENIFWLGIACALLLLTRSEGIFLILALAVEHFRQRRCFPALKYFIIPFSIIAAAYIFNYFYYGKFLPDTGMAKIYQGQSGLWGSFIQKSLPFFPDYHIGWFFAKNHWLLYLVFASAAVGVVALGFASLNIILIVFLLGYSAFYVLLYIPAYHWYYGPYYIIVLFYSAFGLIWAARNLLASQDLKFRALSILFLIFAVYMLSYQSFKQTTGHHDFGKPIQHYKKIGLWLKEYTRRQ